MAKSMYGDLLIKGFKALQLEDSDTNIVSLKAPSALSADYTLFFPSSDGNADELMSTDGSGNLSFLKIANANVDAAAAIAYSKLSLSNSIVNADINASAAIAYSKLALSNSIVNADINSSAAIAFSKMAALTASRALASDGSGFVSVSATTSTELGYVSGVTSAIQTQLDDKASKALSNLASVAINTSLISDTNNLDDLGSAAIGWAGGYINKFYMDSNSQTTTLAGSASASASVNYLLPPADGSSGYVLSTNGSGVMSWVSNASSSSFADDWVTADTATKAITHSLGSKDVLVQIYDKANDSSIEIDSVVRTSINVVTVSASEAPNASGWRVLILKI